MAALPLIAALCASTPSPADGRLPPAFSAAATRVVHLEADSPLLKLATPVPLVASEASSASDTKEPLSPQPPHEPRSLDGAKKSKEKPASGEVLLFEVGRDWRYRVGGDGVVEFDLGHGVVQSKRPGEELFVAGEIPGENKPAKLAFRRESSGEPTLVNSQVVVARLSSKDVLTFVDLDGNGYFDDFGVDGVLEGEPEELEKLGEAELRAKLQTFLGYHVARGHAWLVGLRPMTRVVFGEVTPTLNVAYLCHMGQLNQLRRAGGLSPVGLDEKLIPACEAHARYCDANGLCHGEDSSKPQFTQEGDHEGHQSVVGTGGSAVEGLLGMFTTLYHRDEYLWPGLVQVGVGFAQHSYVCDVKTHTSAGTVEPIEYPFDRQTRVATNGGEESPDCKPGGLDRIEGMLIAVLFNTGQRPDFVDARIVNMRTNDEVPFAYTSPTSPALIGRSMFPTNHGAICLFPRQVLAPDTIYEVHLRCRMGGPKPLEKVWRFWTSK
jgi:hypothetical protein